MLLKWGVNPFFGHRLLAVKNKIDRIHERVVGREAIVTSANDGRHSYSSKHYTDEALDLRTRDLTHEQITALAAALQQELGADWDVVVEDKPPHIHIEYDPKPKGKRV